MSQAGGGELQPRAAAATAGQERTLRRLRNIEGQVRGLARMVEESAYCVDILNQIAAVRAALKGVNLLVLRQHLNGCVVSAVEKGGKLPPETVPQLLGVLSSRGAGAQASGGAEGTPGGSGVRAPRGSGRCCGPGSAGARTGIPRSE